MGIALVGTYGSGAEYQCPWVVGTDPVPRLRCKTT